MEASKKSFLGVLDTSIFFVMDDRLAALLECSLNFPSAKFILIVYKT